MKSTAWKTFGLAALLLLGIHALPSDEEPRPDGLYARLNTSKGVIVLSLEFEKAPLTTANFIGLAEGTIENGVFPLGRPFFNGSRFHRVVPGHVIQAGAPDREGVEETDYTFPNEIVPG
ncbi:MAG TPA: peptidylprolyl isomerase, partial [Acidobacteriota bacterium]